MVSGSDTNESPVGHDILAGDIGVLVACKEEDDVRSVSALSPIQEHAERDEDADAGSGRHEIGCFSRLLKINSQPAQRPGRSVFAPTR